MAKPTGFKGCPILGVGIGLRGSLLEPTLAATDILDWVEICPENFMGKGGGSKRMLERAMEKFPVISHGVTLSIGSMDPWDEEYLSKLEELFQWLNPPWFSDHLCYGGIEGIYFNDLIPIPRTKEAVEHIVKRIRYIQSRFDRPFLIENISYYMEYPENELSDEDFLAEILEKSDCGLLLDVNNVYVNSLNHQKDPVKILERVPLERVVQIHTAGHDTFPDGVIDTHGSPVCEGVWELLEWTLQRSKPCGVMIERDQKFPPFDELREELIRIGNLWTETQPQAHHPSRGVIPCS